MLLLRRGVWTKNKIIVRFHYPLTVFYRSQTNDDDVDSRLRVLVARAYETIYQGRRAGFALN